MRSKFRVFSDFFESSSQERPRAPQECPKSAPRAAKSAPRAPREHPRAPQERPKSAPRAPKSVPRAAQERPETLRRILGDCFDAWKVGKSVFRKRSVARIVRKARSQRLHDDFSTIFESCTQRPNLDFDATLSRIRCFFQVRVFFERMGPLEQERMEKTENSSP